ncbi:hypothetical protein CSUI_007781, partial [Cystoisospora suis]
GPEDGKMNENMLDKKSCVTSMKRSDILGIPKGEKGITEYRGADTRVTRCEGIHVVRGVDFDQPKSM